MKLEALTRRAALRRAAAATAAVCAAPLIPPLAAHSGHRGRSFFAYVGTYTGGKSKGIFAFRFDASHGVLEPVGWVAEIASPAFLAVHPSKPLLYSVNEMGEFRGKKAGGVSAFRVNRKDGKLTLINQVSAGGPGPCHLTVDRTGRCVLVANYGGGSVASFKIGPGGELSEAVSFIQHQGSSTNPNRQKEPHAHSINVSPNNRFAYAADLGLDKVLIYRLDAKAGTLKASQPAAASVAPGSGPRHFTFHPGGRFAYVINEMVCTITAFEHDAKSGALREIQTLSTLPDGEPLKPEYSTAEIVAHPSGRFIYGSNRGHHTIAGFRVRSDGRLEPAGHASTEGKTPRNFAIDPTGAYLLAENQSSDTIAVLAIDPSTGALRFSGHKVDVPSPVCVRFVKTA
ncbi:MAG: lactonase family protein [Verrucomicrobia bacterium]|nr:lactonase family protein [Verrucomicrobiota bacterium]